ARPVPPEIAAMVRDSKGIEAALKAEARDSETLWPAGNLSASQLDGTACVRCGELLPAVSVPAGRATGFGQVFACAPSCPGGAS
ncbi:hypothetical protein, partial [Embleya sp. NPDC001921]